MVIFLASFYVFLLLTNPNYMPFPQLLVLPYPLHIHGSKYNSKQRGETLRDANQVSRGRPQVTGKWRGARGGGKNKGGRRESVPFSHSPSHLRYPLLSSPLYLPLSFSSLSSTLQSSNRDITVPPQHYPFKTEAFVLFPLHARNKSQNLFNKSIIS